MCIFSGNIQNVRGTEIFARLDGRGRQYLVYSMEYRAASDMAMILPLPVSSHADDAIEFLSLENHTHFFAEISQGFVPRSLSRRIESLGTRAASANLLPVHDVGVYEASFVPNLDDFERLDPRFKLPRQTWDQRPIYSDYGFAVFKLRATPEIEIEEIEEEEYGEVKSGEKNGGRYVLGKASSVRSAARAHPMAFLFPTRAAEALFFPTVHIHDGICHEREHFDHLLYFQGNSIGAACQHQRYAVTSYGKANEFMQTSRTYGIVDGEEHCFRRTMKGFYQNQDAWADQGGVLQPLI